jgi:hypothetical protein
MGKTYLFKKQGGGYLAVGDKPENQLVVRPQDAASIRQLIDERQAVGKRITRALIGLGLVTEGNEDTEPIET